MKSLLFPHRHRRKDAGLPDDPAATPFRSFAASQFWNTPSWAQLERLLKGNGGSFGLYGPRGSGKSWLMLNAIDKARGPKRKYISLWFPCPSEYEASVEAGDFLSALADNLASAVEQRYVQAQWRVQWRRRALYFLAALAVALIAVQVVFYGVHAGLNGVWLHRLWIWLSFAVIGCAVLVSGAFIALFLPIGRITNGRHQLAQEATSLRERIRYTADQKLTRQATVSGGSGTSTSISQTVERSLSERPTTVASLVYDFRRLAERIVKVQRHHLVIGIDELDKMKDFVAVRKLLRDIKGIFEIPGVYFLVSVSKEATAALQLGALRENGRNEFNSSFYTVLELPPLCPAEIIGALADRGRPVSLLRAQLLCLLSVGNWREVIRLADDTASLDESDPAVATPGSATPAAIAPAAVAPAAAVPAAATPVAADTTAADTALAMRTMRAELHAVQDEIVRIYRDNKKIKDVPKRIWDALSPESFDTPENFASAGKSAIDKGWTVTPSDQTPLDSVDETWGRFLIRLFVIGQVVAQTVPAMTSGQTGQLLLDDKIGKLLDVLIRAEDSASAARKLIPAPFKDQLPDE